MDWFKIAVVILAIGKVIDWIRVFKRYKRNRGFKSHKYIGDNVLRNGNTEMFNTDISKLDGFAECL